MLLVRAQHVRQVALVPDQRAVKQFVAAGPYLPFRDRVHARHPDTTKPRSVER
jgi:hypothetical protein